MKFDITLINGSRLTASFDGCDSTEEVRTWLNGGEPEVNVIKSVGAFVNVGDDKIINWHHIVELERTRDNEIKWWRRWLNG